MEFDIKRKQIRDALIEATYFGGKENYVPGDLDVRDIEALIEATDRVFLDGMLNDLFKSNGSTLNISLDPQTTMAIATSNGPKIIQERRNRYKLNVSPMITAGKASVGGLQCKSQLECLQMVVEHELAHIILMETHYDLSGEKQYDQEIYGSHGKLFREVVAKFFGHTDVVHEIEAADRCAFGKWLPKHNGMVVNYTTNYFVVLGDDDVLRVVEKRFGGKPIAFEDCAPFVKGMVVEKVHEHALLTYIKDV